MTNFQFVFNLIQVEFNLISISFYFSLALTTIGIIFWLANLVDCTFIFATVSRMGVGFSIGRKLTIYICGQSREKVNYRVMIYSKKKSSINAVCDQSYMRNRGSKFLVYLATDCGP